MEPRVAPARSFHFHFDVALVAVVEEKIEEEEGRILPLVFS